MLFITKLTSLYKILNDFGLKIKQKCRLKRDYEAKKNNTKNNKTNIKKNRNFLNEMSTIFYLFFFLLVSSTEFHMQPNETKMVLFSTILRARINE